MCKTESPQSHESRAQAADSSKSRAFICRGLAKYNKQRVT